MGRLHPLYPGAYAFGYSKVRAEGNWMAAVLACGDDALLSHVDAAAHLGLLPVGSGHIHVTVPGRSRRQIRGLRLHPVRRLHPDDRATREGIPVTKVARTIFDLAETEPRRRAVRAFEQAERLGLLDMRALHRLCERSHGRHGLKPIKALLLHCSPSAPDARTELELRFVELCRDHGLPMPGMNVSVEGFEVDHWPGTNLIVELDSFRHHSPRSAFEGDRERDAVLQLAGYRVLRLTWRMVSEEPKKVAQRILRLLAD
jgi:Protein of unknown function (DUF559)